jgi:ribosomal protein S18 acetylase RimI-like enzyme
MGTTRKIADPGAPIVVGYREEFREAFEQLNRAWIEAYFVLEEPDREVFSDPRAKILEPGGEIFFVLEGGQVQGTCAVIRHNTDECEIAKMAVAPTARGRGFGDLLMERAIAFAAEIGVRRVIIVSNTILEPAIRLYRKHGFVQVPLEVASRYERANIRLERELRSTEPAALYPEASGG